MLANRRQTNVVWSFNESCLNDKLIETVGESEVDAIRITVDYKNCDRIAKSMASVRQALSHLSQNIPIVVDLMPASRGVVSGLEGPVEYLFGQPLILRTDKAVENSIFVKTDAAEKLFRKNSLIFFGSGAVVLKTVEISGNEISTEVVQGGTIYPDMEIHVPDTRKPPRFADLVAVTEAIIATKEADFIVIPALESVDDLKRLIALVTEEGGSAPWPILKVANQYAVDALPQMLPLVKGVLVSRMEMALSMAPAKVPMLTKELIQTCNTQAKITLVASDILASMRHNATPTRAEVSDIANAALDGADGLILSEDLPYGPYPLRGLHLASKVVEDVEQGAIEDGIKYNWRKKHPDISEVLEAVTYTAYRTAKRNKAKAIVCITEGGNTALHLSSYQTEIPIIAVTRTPAVLNRLNLVRGVFGVLLDDFPSMDDILPLISDLLVRKQWLKAGDKIVFVSVSISSIGKVESNLFTVQTLQ